MTSRSLTALALLATLGIAASACRSGGAAPRDPATLPTIYGGARPVTLTAPATLEPGRRYPLVLVLHGYGSTGAWHVLYFGLAGLAADPGALVLAPDGTVDSTGKRFWDASPACCGFAGPEVDDVAYLGGLVEDVMEDWPVDPARIVVVGHSNGGFMAYRLACERADLFTGIAGLAGAMVSGGLACTPSRAVNVLHVHGDQDTVIRYAGGELFGGPAYPGAVASVEAWAAANRCAGTWTAGAPVDYASNLPGAETATRAADGCPQGGAVALWTVEGGAHVPGADAGGGRAMVEWLLARPRSSP